MLDAPEDTAGLSRNEDTCKVARGDLVGVTGMASVLYYCVGTIVFRNCAHIGVLRM